MSRETNVPEARIGVRAIRDDNDSTTGTREDLLNETPQTVSWSIFSVMTYTVLALGVYAYASYELRCEAKPLEDRCGALELKRHNAQQAVRELKEIVGSLSDPAADEYALITELGRIPEGSRKMLLTPPPSS